MTSLTKPPRLTECYWELGGYYASVWGTKFPTCRTRPTAAAYWSTSAARKPTRTVTAADVRYLKNGCAVALRQLRDRRTVQRSGLRPEPTD